MKLIRLGAISLFVLCLGAAATVPAAAQTSISNADIQRLQDDIYDASRDVSQLRSRDAGMASQLQAELDDMRDETVYLKVKLRKHEAVSSGDFNDLRDRIENVRSRARGDASGRYSAPAGSGVRMETDPRNDPVSSASRLPPQTRSNPNEIPVGTEFDVRLQNSLSSSNAQVEDRFEATTLVDLQDERGRVLIPAGSTMRGIVSSVTKTTRTERTGKLTVAFDRVTLPNGRSYPMRATVTQALQSEGIRGEAGKIGIGAAAGGILGAILGGGKGALAGILIGGGGTVAATEGKDVDLPSGTTLRVRLDSPLQLR